VSGVRLELLYEERGLPAYDLPSEVVEAYGGSLGLDEPIVVANFVSSLDGVVAAPPLEQSATVISAKSEADRFVMSLLRSLSDAIVVASGTLHASPRSLWSPAGPYPRGAEAFAEIRRSLGLAERPLLVVLTGSGRLDPAHPALERGALVLTTDGGAAALADKLPHCEIAPLGGGSEVDVRAGMAHLLERGSRVVLAEAGPHAFGSLVAAGVVDELFLTLSPVLAGREDGVTRLGLVEGHDLLPRSLIAKRLLSVRRDEAHLFLRYRLRDAV
jgi:riboflavin biosynthesis pyrimidine reductase